VGSLISLPFFFLFGGVGVLVTSEGIRISRKAFSLFMIHSPKYLLISVFITVNGPQKLEIRHHERPHVSSPLQVQGVQINGGLDWITPT